MITVPEVETKLSAREARRTTVSAPAEKLTLDEHAHLCIDGLHYELTPEARGNLARRASIPCDFFEKCAPDVQCYLFNRLHGAEGGETRLDETVNLVIEDGTRVIGLVQGGLALLSGREVLDIALAQCPSHIDKTSLQVPSLKLNGHLRVSIVTSRICSKPRVGDVVYGGIDILHSDTAAFGTNIRSYLVRLACRNGVLLRTCQHEEKAASRIRRAAESNRQVTCDRIAEMSRRAWHELAAKLKAVQELAEHRVEDVTKLIGSIGERLRFSDRLVNQVVEAVDNDELRPSATAWDVVNALSRVGTHLEGLSEARQRYLQELSGDLINERVPQCPTCGRLLPRQMRLMPRR